MLIACPDCGGASAVASPSTPLACGVCMSDHVLEEYYDLVAADLLKEEVPHYNDEQLARLALRGSKKALELLAERWARCA